MAAQSALLLEETCIMCPRRGSKFCGKCHTAQYCSKECQKLDWNFHKRICASFKEPKPIVTEPNGRIDGRISDYMPRLGTVDYRRGLFFPGGKQAPRFVWIKIWVAYPGYDTFDDGEYLGKGGPDRTFTAHSNIQARDIGRDEEDTLVFMCKEDATQEPPNLAVRDSTRSGACSSYMRGPIMVIREWVDQACNNHIRDMDMRDARSAADFFSSAYRNGMKDPRLEQLRVMGTAIVCRDDIVRSNLKNEYVDGVFNGCDSIFMAEGSGIANLLGFPILIRPSQRPKMDDGDTNAAGAENSDAGLLLRDITSTTIGPQGKTTEMRRFRSNDRDYAGENGFGSSPKICKRMGSVWVVRADGIPLPSQHIQALVGYIRDRVEPRLSKAVSGLSPGQVVTEREAVLNSITRAEFEEYFAKFCLEDERMTVFLPSPYQMNGV